MNIDWRGKQPLGTVHAELEEELFTRARAPERFALPDHVIIFEPEECFSYQHPRNLDFIHDREAFTKYCAERGISSPQRMRRGGGMMWHGPGQIIMAPLVDLKRKDMHTEVLLYLELLLQVCLRTAADFGINASVNRYTEGAQGVWAQNPADGTLKKFGFVGLHHSRGMAMHGCAINVSCDLSGASLVWPCDLAGAEVTSMQAILGAATPSLQTVGATLVGHFTELFNNFGTPYK